MGSSPTQRVAALGLLAVAGCGNDEAAMPAVDSWPPTAAPAPVAEPGVPLFEDLTGASGLDFFHINGANGAYYLPEIAGSGVALLDYDRDGDLDVYLLQGSTLGTAVGPAIRPGPPGQPGGNRLFRNDLDANGLVRFVDVTEVAGVGDTGYGFGAAVGDIDNDGDPDLFVTNLGPNVLYRNEGDGRFSVVDSPALAGNEWSTSAAFVDFDLDGDLDLYYTDYVVFDPSASPRCQSAGGNRDYCGPQNFSNEPDRLFRNDGRGGFEDVSTDTGIATVAGPGLGVTAADFNADGWPDIYVANDGEPNFLWINRNGRSFDEVAMVAGAAVNLDAKAEAGMGVAAGDYDNDGDDDLFMTHLLNETNTLYRNDGTGAFMDVTDRSGLGFASLRRTGFGTGWFDYDADGWLDLFIANGAVKLEERRSDESVFPFAQPNQLFRNEGGQFRDVSAAAGTLTQMSTISRGTAFGDIDNDGLVDIVVADNGDYARVFRNLGRDGPARAHAWLRLRLIGTDSNRDAYGAIIRIETAGRAPLWRRVHTDGSYLSASDARVNVGLGAARGPAAVTVTWPGGATSTWPALALNREHILAQEPTKPSR